MDLKLIKNVSGTSECKTLYWVLEFRSDLKAFFFPESSHAELIFKEKECNLDFEHFSKDLYCFHLS